MRFANWIRTAVLVVALGLAICVRAEAQTSVRNDLIDLLQEISEQTPVREDLVRFGFEGPKLELAERQSRAFMRDRRIAGFVADQLIAANSGQVPVHVSDDGFITPLITRGMGHLSTAEMRHFYAIEHLIMRSFPERDCGLAVKERLTYRRWIELSSRVEAKLSMKTLQSYYRIQLKSAKLGATRKPVKLSDAQMVAIATRVNTALEQAIAGREDGRRIVHTMNNLNRVNNRRACEAGILFMDTVLSLKGRELRDALLMLSQ